MRGLVHGVLYVLLTLLGLFRRRQPAIVYPYDDNDLGVDVDWGWA